MKEPSKLFVGQQSGHIGSWIASRQCGVGHIRRIAGPQQESREVTNEDDSVLLGYRTFVRFLRQPVPGNGSGQFQCRQSFLHQEIVKAVQDSSRLLIHVPTGVLFLKKLIHERGENAVELDVGCIIRHDSPPPDPAPRSARLPHPPSRRSVSIPNWCAPKSQQWSSMAFPSPEAESLRCGVANGCPAFVEPKIGSLPTRANG